MSDESEDPEEKEEKEEKEELVADAEEFKAFLKPSPNFDERNPDVHLRYVVLHYTGMPTRDVALQRLCNPKSKVSAHYLIDDEGRLFKLVEEDKRAWHAGKGFWRGATDINSASIGIELVNPGHAYGYTKFPKAQTNFLKDLLKEVMKRNRLNPATALLAHADIAPDRKEDPGELFPWEDFAKEGFGLWPSVERKDYEPIQDFEEQKLLRTIGYDCPDNGVYDPPTRAALLAFQRRYDPANITGTPERETIARMRALVRAIAKT